MITYLRYTAVTDAVSEILGKEGHGKKPKVTRDVLDLCDERRFLRKRWFREEGANECMTLTRAEEGKRGLDRHLKLV